ncbi:Dihydroorotate dehydrogenase quinone, mitochondrial [Hondaea fermentalgiana]|uniref:Dihydroorotate dehydrogenase (quinone), mitochondrial n=1 Tax=Hondaea fermentalgiana TaxID=2315210 RepID=A0A2R5GAC5_9STRA|nr:Dihydroorotate dehydrogenase quinone, mitochondrial [Hondaea fermentalgiana]|eukprot:GBG25503.1 Dihydroorotate dehydrogenase quinone, mitochondrial [Hondaea fermentalgiana]
MDIGNDHDPSHKPRGSDTPRSTSRGGRGFSYAKAEDECLISAYVNVSEDSIRGTNQKAEEFWNSVQAKMLELMARKNVASRSPVVRTSIALRNRVRTIERECKRYIFCNLQARKTTRSSGWSESDYVERAEKLYFEEGLAKTGKDANSLSAKESAALKFKFAHVIDIIQQMESLSRIAASTELSEPSHVVPGSDDDHSDDDHSDVSHSDEEEDSGWAGIGCAVGYGYWTQDERVFNQVIMPMVHTFTDGEQAHRLGVLAAKYKLIPRPTKNEGLDLALKQSLWDLEFANPVGLAAGFDKNAEGVEGMARTGFGFVEIGSVTPEPQPGNPKPRVFRLPQDQAVINRYGFNSDGHAAVKANLEAYLSDASRTPCVLGINLGKNKTSPSAIEDYGKGVREFATMADYLVVNISSPNTPGLRNLQAKRELDELISNVVQTRDEVCAGRRRTPVVLKIAPDLSEDDKQDIADVVTSRGVDGLIVSNTTIARPETLVSDARGEVGGLSGMPVKDKSTAVIRDMYRLTQGKVPIIGVGGISTGIDAYEKLKAGASLVQLYTALTYQGFPLVNRLNRELKVLMERDGYHTIAEVVGKDHEK